MKLDSLLPNAFYDMVSGMPICLYKDNDGSFLYRYNIQPQMEIDEVDGKEKQVGWKCREIRIWEHPTKDVLKKAILRSVVDETMELGIINAYNKHILGIKKNQQAVEDYKQFLLFTEEVDALLDMEVKE